MFTAQNYVVPETIEEAWTLNQNKSNKIVGGMLWLKMSHKSITSVIDLSGLSLDFIEENEKEFRIGATCSLRTLERNQEIEAFFNGAVGKSLESIVGVQFRNLATVGGSVYSRFGFSDLLTILMALDSYVELHKGGMIPLAKYVDMPYDRDVLKSVIIRKQKGRTAYESLRNTATDFPVLACAINRSEHGVWKIIYGARPGKAIEFQNNLPANPSEADIEEISEAILAWERFGSNMRSSKEYRSLIAPELLKKAILQITAKAEV